MDPQPPEDPNPTRRKRRSNSNGRSQANEAPPVLLRLSEACSSHKKTHDALKTTTTHHESQTEGRGGKATISPKCVEDLKNLRVILSQADEFYKDAGGSETIDLSSKAEKSPHMITSSDISNLCVFYGAVLSSTFCPHSLSLLDYGHDVNEVVHRVFNLMRFFTCECIVQDALNHIKRIFSRKSPKSSTCVSDQIAFTAAAFLNTLHPQHIIDTVLIDLVTMLYDLSILASLPQPIPKAGSSKAKSSSIELQVFIETNMITNPDATSSPFFFRIPTYESLASLQCGILRIIFILLVLRRAKVAHGNSSMEDIDQFSVLCHSGEERLACYSTHYLLDLIKTHGDFRATLVISLKQMIANQNHPSLDISCELLLLNTKLTACNLLTLILPDFSKAAEDNTWTVSIWSDISELVSFAVHAHMVHVQRMYKDTGEGKVSPIMESINAQISTQLSTLLRDTIIVPHYPYKPDSMTMLKIRNRSVRNLWDSLGHLADVASRPSQFGLCRVILRSIHCSLHVGASSLRFSHEKNIYDIYSLLNDVKIQARAYFLSHGLVSHLLSLVGHDLGPLSIPILTELSQTVNIEFLDESLLSDPAVDEDSLLDPTIGKRPRLSLDGDGMDLDLKTQNRMSYQRRFYVLSDPCFQSFVDRAVRFAESITQDTADLDTSYNFDAFKVLDLITAIELSESLLPNVHKNCESDALQILYKALRKLVLYLRLDTSVHSVLGLPNTTRILKRMVSYSLRSSTIQKCADTLNNYEALQESLLQAMAELVWKHLMTDTSINDDKPAENVVSSPNEYEPFDSSVISMLSQRHKEIVTSYVNSCVQSCQNSCTELRIKLGLTVPQNCKFCVDHLCLCALNCDYHSLMSFRTHRACFLISEGYYRSLDNFLMEDTIPWPQRCSIMIVKGKTLTVVDDRPSINTEMHKWISAKPEFAPVYLAILPMILLQMTSFRNVPDANIANTATDSKCVLSFAFNRYKIVIQQIDLNETLNVFTLKGDVSIHTSVLNCLSSILHFYSVAIDRSLLSVQDSDSEASSMKYSSVSLSSYLRFVDVLFKQGPSIVTLLRSDFSSDIYSIPTSENKGNNDSNQGQKSRIVTCILQEIKVVTSQLDHFQFPNFRQALWRCLSKCLFLSDNDSLQKALSMSLYSRDRGAQPALDWLVGTCFQDENESIRNYGAYRLGHLLATDNFKTLRAFTVAGLVSSAPLRFDQDPGIRSNIAPPNMANLHPGLSSSKVELAQQFMAKCDNWINVYVSRSPMVDRNVTNISNQYSSNGLHDVMISSPYSHVKTATLIFSSICQYIQPDSDLGSLLLAESVLRIVRFFLLPLENQEKSGHSGLVDMHKISMYDIISSVAIEELHYLGDHLQLWKKLRESCEDLITPMLFREFMSHAKIEKRRSSDSLYRCLFHFIQNFLLNSAMKSGIVSHQDELERCDNTLFFTDEVLPAVISTVVVKQEYDILLACTGFRWSLARYVTAARKNRGRHFTSEYIIGMVFRHHSFKDSLTHSFGREELKRQTSLLCRSDNNSLKILGRLLSSLLLEPSLTPLRFFLGTVLQAEASLRDLFVVNEIKIIVGIIWELGVLEKEMDPYDTRSGIDVYSLWTDAKFDNYALRALKRGAAILKNRDGNLDECIESLNAMESAKEGFTLDAIEATEKWVRSNFMMLLVNVDNTKWKGGRVATKLQALKCLKVLMRFLLPEDASKFMTQVLTMIDAAMHLKCSAFDPPFASSRLRLLGVSSLSHFIHLAVSHQVKVVGDALCQIVVILFPLLNDEYVESTMDPYHRRATVEAAAMFESLLSGIRGPELAHYFRFVPFLPVHPLLQKTRSFLKQYGIDLDSLVSGVECHEQKSIHKNRSNDIIDVDASSITSADWTGNTDDSKTAYFTSKCAALRAYLRVSEYLVRHQNENVRYAALSHLTLVLNRNRGLFHFLIESEDVQSRFLTIIRDDDTTDTVYNQDVDKISNLSLLRGGSISTTTRSLLRRCTEEANDRNRLALASCLGEVGAIDPSFIDQHIYRKSIEIEKGKGSVNKKSIIPWNTNAVIVDFQLNLVTKHFVAALKACPTPREQHKIAFAIQEVLKLLDRGIPVQPATGEHVSMSPWLLDYLTKVDVIDVIRPFWTSLYKQQEPAKHRDPPFYFGTETFFSWVSSWTRYMIENSHRLGKSPFSGVFFACRSAIRSLAGIGIIVYILPMLVLDAIVFGDDASKEAMVSEIIGVLSAHERLDKLKMNHIELLKSIDCIFTLLDTLQTWCNTGVEYQYRYGSQSSSLLSDCADDYLSSLKLPLSAGICIPWSPDICINAIDDLLDAIPLRLRAKTAASVGMHARALIHIEMEGRWHHSADFDERHQEKAQQFDRERKENKKFTIAKTHLDNIDLSLMQFILGELNDIDSMSALAQYRDRNGLTRTYSDKIQEKEYNCDFDGVIQVYEQAVQIGLHMPNNSNSNHHLVNSLNASYARALLKMGRLESAHLHVQGILSCDFDSDRGKLVPSAVEASWRLSRWDHLDKLMQSISRHADESAIFDSNISRYQLFCGKALLGIHKNDHQYVRSAIEESRNAVMSALAITAQENYSRVYPYLITLHSMTEIEEAAQLLCGDQRHNASIIKFADRAVSDSFPGWNWKSRLDLTGRDAEAAIPLLHVRVSLSRLALANEVEAKLWLDIGKLARKCGQNNIAIDALAHAEVLHELLIEENTMDDSGIGRALKIAANECRLQLAKIMHASGKSSLALQMLEDETFQGLQLISPGELTKEIHRAPLRDDIEAIARNALQTTEWLIDGGFKTASEVIARYRLLLRLVPSWEKAHFSFAKYLDSVLYHRANSQSKADDLKMDDDLLRMEALKVDEGCQKLLLDAVQEYIMALRLNQKHVFLCLPRLLTLWFDFTAMEGASTLRSNQDKANALLRDNFRNIPPISFYTVLPQLISRLSHRDQDTCAIVSSILKRVLTKFPKQAMWSLAWLRNSIHPERQLQGEDIFKAAQKGLQRCIDMTDHNVLVASKGLFSWLIHLAKYQPKKPDARNIRLRGWTGEVELNEFLPPVQAALTITRNVIGGSSGKNVEPFPPFVPRMRAFSPDVTVMSSKAKPKKLTAYAVPLGCSPRDKASASVDTAESQSGDIGEMHFLVKQEAKGDLRKDARVQDFNNVVNRLLATSSIRSGSGKKKRRLGDLRLRTFSVICLSEDCGVIEWVPHTNSLRNVIYDEAYNPQAPPISSKRRGQRMADFGDPNLRDTFQKCQDMYMKGGNLSGAVKMFDELCIREYPPLLYWWFIHKFKDPHQWFEARTLFTLSAAVWSAVGHVIGLGDRHSENMLIDVSSGECVHVDFDCIFDKGLHLPTPEVVPFRLTPNILDAFGPSGAEGAYSGSLCSVMSTLRENRDLLLSVLEPFLKDPIIDWKRHRGQQVAFGDKESSGAIEAKRSIKVIEERLKGIYNLRNPNYKKIRRTDGQASLTDDDDMAYIIPLSVEGQVHKLISEACSHENLVQLYVGWMSWL